MFPCEPFAFLGFLRTGLASSTDERDSSESGSKSEDVGVSPLAEADKRLVDCLTDEESGVDGFLFGVEGMETCLTGDDVGGSAKPRGLISDDGGCSVIAVAEPATR